MLSFFVCWLSLADVFVLFVVCLCFCGAIVLLLYADITGVACCYLLLESPLLLLFVVSCFVPCLMLIVVKLFVCLFVSC